MDKIREQEIVRCTIMRGGTSKAVFIKNNELPSDVELRNKIILAIFGSPDLRQIDGLGGSDITTSKVAIIGPPTHEDADIDYTFGQVQITEAEVGWDTNCGNISSAVAPYAIDEGMVKVTEPYTYVRIHNTNTKKILVSKVQVKNRKAVVCGDYVVDGVPGTGARIDLDYRMTWGSATGKLLPTGNVVDILKIDGLGDIPVSIVDIANPACFVKASDIGITGTEARPDIIANPELMVKLEKIRSHAAVRCGFVDKAEEATAKSPCRPMISFVAPPTDYKDYVTGRVIRKEDVDFLGRVLWNQLPTETFTGTGTICVAVASQIEGSIVNQVCSPQAKERASVRLGHARGVNVVEVEVSEHEEEIVIKKAVLGRTARRIMDGYVYIKPDRI